jgi:predicted chitinase
MDYQKAKNIRGKKFSELMTDKLVAGEGLASSFAKTISERSKARSTGLKEKFDPLNIAKILTGGSRLGPALLGKMTGASKERISYFAGDPKKKKIEALASGIKPESLETATSSLGNIYELLKKDKEEKKLQRELSYSKEEEQEFEEDKRNRELIKALTARVKPRKKKKVEEKKAEEPKEPEKPAPARKGKGKAPTKTTEKPTGPPAAPKPTAPTPATPKPTAPAAPKPTAPTPATPKPTATPAPKAPTPATAAKIPPVVVGGSKGLVLSALVAAGYSKQAQANVMANVEKESNFKPRSEELNKYSAKTLFKLYGPPDVPGGQPAGGKNKVRFTTLQEAQTIVDKGPEAVGEIIYGGRMGNTSPGDGYKYRGRGFLQITGKENYEKVGKIIGVDLVNNPDLANDPEIAAKIVPAFFKLRLKKPEDLENIDKVNTAVGSASQESREKRKKLAATYATELTTGSQIDTASKENKDLKNSLNKDKPKQTVVNNTTVNSEMQNVNPSAENVVDDRPALIKKRDS